MDLIPLPDGVASHVPVPDLGGPDYDNLGFIGFDQRQGWDIRALREGDLDAARNDWESYLRSWPTSSLLKGNADPQDNRIASVAAFLQSWILFGIFHELLKRPVLRNEVWCVTVQNPSSNVGSAKQITVRHLFGEFLAGRHTWDQNLSANLHSIDCLREGAMIISNIVHSPMFPRDSAVLLPVFQSLAVLIEEASSSLLTFCSQLRTDVRVLLRQDYFALKMKEKCRWCPNMTRRIGPQLKNAGLYYASLVPGLVTEQTHDRCDDDICVAYNIDKESYEVQHVPRHCPCLNKRCDHRAIDCRCKAITVPDISFRAAFKNGTFPLIRLKEDVIEVVEYARGTAFVAISHPWSDRRGNPAANALPVCQLREINEYVTENWHVDWDTGRLKRITLFWIDTLCVPIEEPLRNTAILAMAKVYSSAHRVLVLSAELVAVKRPETAYEALVRVHCSKWNTRLWLLHEAALARDITFQFSNGATSYRNISVQIEEDRLSPMDQSVLWAEFAHAEFVSMATGRNSGVEGRNFPCTLDVLWDGFRHRTSSRPLDATICASIVLGTDLRKVLAAPDSEKVRTFWACQSKVPSSILFVDGPHLNSDGFRWAPKDLLNPRTASKSLRNPTGHGPGCEAYPTINGLLIHGLKTILIQMPKAHLSEPHIYLFSLPGSSNRYYFMLGDPEDHEVWITVVEELGPQWDGRCAFLLDSGLQSHWDRAAITIPSPRAKPIEHDGETTHYLYTRYILPIAIRQDGSEWDSRLYFAYRGHTGDNWPLNLGPRHVTELGEVQRVEASQKWCVY